jgi:hypothetical protein
VHPSLAEKNHYYSDVKDEVLGNQRVVIFISKLKEMTMGC